MGVDPFVLYSTLLEDLSDAVTPSVLDIIVKNKTPWPEITYQQQAALSIACSLLKKLEVGMTKETEELALNKFLQVNIECKNWVNKMDQQFGDDFLLGEFKNSLWKFWHRQNGDPVVDTYEDILDRGGVGPGAAIGSPGGDFYTKLFSSELSCTSSTLYSMYRAYIRQFPTWHEAEMLRYTQYGAPSIVAGNRLSFVPKNDEISRTICTEPVLNMFFQLGFGNILSSRLNEFAGVNLPVQQVKNRELARIGSMDESFVTIDLSSASDSISTRMLEEYLPADFLSILKTLRSPVSRLPNGRSLGLNMVSTMGNGSTFPLQTVLFTCVVLSAFRLDGLAPIFPRGHCLGNFGVNGDDIVVPRRVCGKVLRLLHLLGFKTNSDKTFVEGPFRESCGGDYFKGRNLRGVYVKRLHEPQDLYSVINQLNLFSTRTGIVLKRSVQLLLRKVKWLPVPPWENDDAGIKVPFSVVDGKLPINEDTQSMLYTVWTPRVGPRIRILERVYTPRLFKPRMYNPAGLHISFLQGSVNDNTISLIPKRVKYHRKPRIAPNWHPVLMLSLLEPEGSYAMTVRLSIEDSRSHQLRWETAVNQNLF